MEVSSRLDALSRRGEAARLPVEARQTAALVRGCARTLLLSMPPGVYEAVPELKMVWATAFEGVSGVEVPEGVDPAALRADSAERESLAGGRLDRRKSARAPASPEALGPRTIRSRGAPWRGCWWGVPMCS